MKNWFLILLGILLLNSCSKDLEPNLIEYSLSVFSTEFNKNLDWCTTVSESITLTNLTALKVTILALVNELLRKVNEANYYDGITINYDIPKGAEVFVMGTALDGSQFFITKNSLTRAITDFPIPQETPQITGTVTSYEVLRGYPGFEDEILYTTNLTPVEVGGYSLEFTNLFRAAVFTYLPNGKGYNNLPQILANGYYNNDCYAVTTGEEPIIISLVYKNDGGYHEVETAELYYYYFKGEITVAEIKALPKYKALDVSATMNKDDVINKKYSYVLAYFDSETPTYQFPKGYNIGFMLRMNFKDDVKKGELYFDGRLNTKINKHGHFKSSGLGDADPRMCWLSINEVMLMCCEAGTDKDFNDAVFEIEGGIEPIIIPIDPEYNFYTFCFEDRKLGDYDMNDVVLKGARIDNTHVEYTLMATGANDALYIYNVEGATIKNTEEVHDLFKVPLSTFVNTLGTFNSTYIKDIITVDKNFSFLNESTLPYIYNKSYASTIKMARKGQDPHAIMIPYDFRWPLERICVKDAYLQFNNWGKNLIENTTWYLYPEENKVQ